MGKVLFFGYGANRSRSKLHSILNRDPGESVGAAAFNFCLGIQSLKQIPEQIKEMLKNLYGPDFRSYTLIEGQGVVAGAVWKINEHELDLIKNWEFVGSWRELVEIKVLSSGLQPIQVLTEKAISGQGVEGIVDGLIYEEFNLQKVLPKRSEDPFYTQKQVETIRKWLAQQK